MSENTSPSSLVETSHPKVPEAPQKPSIKQRLAARFRKPETSRPETAEELRDLGDVLKEDTSFETAEREEPPEEVEEKGETPPQRKLPIVPKTEQRPLTYQEHRELRAEQMSVKYEIDGICDDIYHLGKGTFTDRVFVEKRMDEVLDWIANDPKIISEAVEDIQSQEDIINRMTTLPCLTQSEQESIKLMKSILGDVRKGLVNRGVDIPPSAEVPKFEILTGLRLSKDTVGIPGVTVDSETAFEYAYHATPLRNTPSIAENGLQPSGPWSKEPGTIFYNGYDIGAAYLPPIGMLYRTALPNIPEVIANKEDYEMDERGKITMKGGPEATASAIPKELLEYSLDRNKTWRKGLGRFKNGNSKSKDISAQPKQH